MHSLGDRLLAWIDPDANPAGTVYGIVTMGALLAAESDRHETYGETVGSAAIALLLYWLVHSYADALGGRLRTQERLTVASLWDAFAHDWAIVRGAGLPLVALLLCWLAGAREGAGVDAALWTAVASLVCFELLAGARAGARAGELVLEAAVGVAMGLAIIAMKLLLER